MTLLLAMTGWDVSAWRAKLAALLPEREVVTLNAPFDPAVIVYALSWRHPPGALRALPNLKVIFSLGAGVDHIFADPELPDVPIVRVVDADLRDRMSEWVVMHALLHLRQLRRYEKQQREKIWADDDHQPKAGDVSVGLLGLGVLGLDAALKLKAMGFAVAGWSATPKSAPDIETYSGEAGLMALLARSDILVALLPLTSATRGLLNSELFAKLKQGGPLGGPILINAGRGGLQVEADIRSALDRGVLKGASLDVFEREPLPPDSPLWAHPGVYVSPHNSAISSPDAILSGIARQIEAFERGEALTHVVDRGRGY